jgi:hypothetical protein
MNKKLKEQLDAYKQWLEDERTSYTVQDFMDVLKKYQDNISHSHYLGLISLNVYLQCKNTLENYLVFCAKHK